MHVSTICRSLAEHGFTRKKVQHASCSSEENGTTSCIHDHGRCVHVSEEMFVWIDESGSDSKDQLRKYGYALRGEKAVCRRLLVHGKRISAIAALSTEGL